MNSSKSVKLRPYRSKKYKFKVPNMSIVAFNMVLSSLPFGD